MLSSSNRACSARRATQINPNDAMRVEWLEPRPSARRATQINPNDAMRVE